MADEWVEKVRQATSLVEMASRYINLRKRGHKWIGLCPFHDEKSPSFQIDPEKQLFYCFGCHTGGDVFRFVEKLEHKSFGEAVRFLSQEAGIAPPERGTAEERDNREHYRQAMLFAEQIYRKALVTSAGQDARTYLLKSRGLTEETLERFRLGWAPGQSVLSDATGANRIPGNAGSAGGIDFIDVLEMSGMIKKGSGSADDRYGDLFRNRVMIPIREREGWAPSGFGGRTIDSSSRFPKYLNSAESPFFRKREILFGLDQALEPMKQKNRAILVEGYFDVIRLSQSGVGEVVAPLGTALGSAHISILKKHVDEVILLFDGDRAGRDAAVKVVGRFLWDPDLQFRAVWLPDGMDPDQWVATLGPDAVRRALDSALPMGDFVLDWLESRVLQMKKNPDGRGREEVVGDFLSMIRSFSDLQVQERLLEKGAVVLETMKDLLAMQLLNGGPGGSELSKQSSAGQNSGTLNNRDLRWRNLIVELTRLWVDGGTPHPQEIWARQDFSFITDRTLSEILDALWSQKIEGVPAIHDLLKNDPFLWKQWYDLPSDPGTRAQRLSDVRSTIHRMSRRMDRPGHTLSETTRPATSSANKGV
jgi:DNA primase